MYTVKIIAEVIDPSDSEYIQLNNEIVEISKEFGCVRSMEHDGDTEIGVFTFPSEDDAKAFRDHPKHVEAMRSIRKFYSSMKIERTHGKEHN